MKVKSEKLKVVHTEKKEGHSEKYNMDYNFTLLYANTEQGIQEQIVVNNEFADKLEKGKSIQIVYQLGFRNRAKIVAIEQL